MRFLPSTYIAIITYFVSSMATVTNSTSADTEPKLIDSFILDCQENTRFLEFLNTYKEAILESLVNQKEKGLLDQMQSFVLKTFQTEVVDVAAIHCYSKYLTMIKDESRSGEVSSATQICSNEERADIILNIIKNLYLEEDKVEDSTGNILQINNVLISKLPILGLRFPKYKELSLDGAGIDKGIEILTELKRLEHIYFGRNSIKKFPDLSRFTVKTVDFGDNTELKISGPESIRPNDKLEKLIMKSVTGIKLYAARLLRTYKNVECDEINYYKLLRQPEHHGSDVVEELDYTALSEDDPIRTFRPASGFIGYSVCNRGLLEFRGKYYEDFVKKMWDIVDEIKAADDNSEKHAILRRNPRTTILDVIDLLITDYYNRYYMLWWNKLENDISEVEREIRADIRENNPLNGYSLELGNIFMSRAPVDDVFDFLGEKVHYTTNSKIFGSNVDNIKLLTNRINEVGFGDVDSTLEDIVKNEDVLIADDSESEEVSIIEDSDEESFTSNKVADESFTSNQTTNESFTSNQTTNESIISNQTTTESFESEAVDNKENLNNSFNSGNEQVHHPTQTGN